MMAESESSNDPAEYVQRPINGKPFRGWVGVTRLKAGVNVDMIAEWQHDHSEVYAIALPEERIVSMCPKCDMGHIAHMLCRIKNMFILIAILMMAFVSVCVFISITKGNPNSASLFERFYLFLVMAFVTSSIISGLIAFFAYKACASTCCKQAEGIFHLMGVMNVSTVNLNKLTKLREQQLKDNGRWHDPNDKSKPACPSGKFIYSDESWFYY
ncbi:TPA: putative type VI secretion system effector [Enterobacter asburiae]